MYKNKIKLVIKFYPLAGHPFSRKAARAALAAYKQEKFWPFHQKLFENYQSIDEDMIYQIARELNLDMDRFKKDINSPDIDRLINRDVKNGREIGIAGTPAVFINGKKTNLESFSQFMKKINSELKKKNQ